MRHILANMAHLCVASLNTVDVKSMQIGMATAALYTSLSNTINIHGEHNCTLHTLCCKCIGSLACLDCKMPMFQRVGMKEGGVPLPLAFQYLILMI